MATHELIVPSRFRGPARSGNGGWSAGALAELLTCAPNDHARHWPTVEVTLTSPPPLDTELEAEVGPDGVSCAYGEAHTTEQEPRTVEPVSYDEARAAEAAYAGLASHPFPTCFACGTDRDPDDGLRIFPGPVDDQEDGGRRVAATWTPHPSVAEDWRFLRRRGTSRLEGHQYADDVSRVSLPVTWAAVDCVGGWAADLGARLVVLGRMRAQVDSLPVIGEPHVVVGQRLGAEGRRTFTAATLYDADGRIVARAEHVWVAVDPGLFN